jgi:BirA family transcriptional regulator, biotin operon repressor / biotin---[acetyl-CoA-carboxylase] ligase
MVSKKTKRLVVTALVCAGAFISYKLYRKRVVLHIARVSSSEVIECIKKSPINFISNESLPAFLDNIQKLPHDTCRNILYSVSTTSTSKVLDEYFGDVQSGLLYVADVQTNGIGRTGPWVSPSGALMFSYKFSCSSEYVLPMQLIIPVAIVRSIKEAGIKGGVSVAGLEIKWPNDIYLQNKKISGILVNSKNIGKTFLMNIGIGINVTNIGEYGSLEEIYPGVFTRSKVLENYIIQFEKLVSSLNVSGGDKSIVEEYKSSWMHYNKLAFLPKINEQVKIVDITPEGNIAAIDQNDHLYYISNREEIVF